MKKRQDKRGDGYYYIILSLILGLMIFAIFLFWVYEEYFTEEDADLQICRQSIEIRANIPDPDIASMTVLELKEEFPLKCKTQVVTIDYEDEAKLEREIAHSIAGCWNLFGEGAYRLFPAQTYISVDSVCVPCARIHVSPKVRDYYLDKEIDIQRGLSQSFKDTNYLGYLINSGPFSAFSLGNARSFILSGERFSVDETDQRNAVFINRETKESEGNGINSYSVSHVTLPKFFDPQKGDLIIYYGSIVKRNTGGVGPYLPYMFYVHSNENYIDEFNNELVADLIRKNSAFCSSFEGIPG